MLDLLYAMILNFNLIFHFVLQNKIDLLCLIELYKVVAAADRTVHATKIGSH